MKNQPQPDFRRFRQALLLQGEPDRVPLYEAVERGVMSNWLGKPVNDVETAVEFRVKAGYDYHSYGADLWYVLKGNVGASVGTSVKDRLSLYKNAPRERVWAYEGTGLVTSMKDFDEFRWPRVEDIDLGPFRRMRACMPPGMRVLAFVGHIFTTVWTLMGLEAFCIALADNPKLVARMFNKVESIQYAVLDIVTKLDGVGAVTIHDDLAYTHALMISPKHLRQYLFPVFERMCALCKKRDIPVICHSDGNTTEVLEDIAAIGFNGLHPIPPNAMDIKAVKAKVGNKLCFLGNIDGDVMTRGTPEQVVALVKKNLKEIAPGGGYILGSSAGIGDFISLENYNTMRETAFKYGTYPIHID